MKRNQYSRHPILHWAYSHGRALVTSLQQLTHAPLASLLTLLVIGIAMALPSGLYVLLKNFQSASQKWDNTPSISLYLKKTITPSQLNKIKKRLNTNKKISDVRYISPKQGLSEFEKLTDWGKALSRLKDNPLPGVLVVTPANTAYAPEQLRHLLNQLKHLPEVSIGKLDMAWVERLYDLVQLGQRLTFALAILFGIGVILIIGNTIRLTTQNHRQEIRVLKLIGATDGFIRRPLLYRGAWYGLFGGLIAWILVALIITWLKGPALALANSYDNSMIFGSLSFRDGIGITLISMVLGLFGSWIATRAHLRVAD